MSGIAYAKFVAFEYIVTECYIKYEQTLATVNLGLREQIVVMHDVAFFGKGKNNEYDVGVMFNTCCYIVLHRVIWCIG